MNRMKFLTHQWMIMDIKRKMEEKKSGLE